MRLHDLVDKGASHVVTIVNGLIFDALNGYARKLSVNELNLSCGGIAAGSYQMLTLTPGKRLVFSKSRIGRDTTMFRDT